MSRRLTAAVGICAVAIGTLATTPALADTPSAHAPAEAATAEVDGAVVIGSRDLEVTLSRSFPQELAGENGAAANVIDGDTSTIWHTEWSEKETAYPHFVAVDLGASHKLGSITVQGRPSGANGRIKDYEVYVSADGQSWGTAVAKGAFTTATSPQKVTFAQPQSARYVKVVGLNSHNGLAFASIAELDFFEVP